MADEGYKLLDHDEDEDESPAKYRLPFALCKKYGIELPDWATPRDAWDALKGIGIDPDREYDALKEKRRSAQETREKRKRKEAQLKNAEHNPDVYYKHKDGYIDGVKKGKPMTFEKADSGAPNPYFGKKDLVGYNTNCQTCVVAYEARRRGYDVRALPNYRNPNIKQLSRNTLKAYEGGQHIRKPSGQNKMKFLRSNIREGERWTLEFKWQKRDAAHIITVEMVSGELYAYDPQSNKKYNEKRLERFMTEETKRETIARVDNLPFNGEFVDRILKGVKKE